MSPVLIVNLDRPGGHGGPVAAALEAAGFRVAAAPAPDTEEFARAAADAELIVLLAGADPGAGAELYDRLRAAARRVPVLRVRGPLPAAPGAAVGADLHLPGLTGPGEVAAAARAAVGPAAPPLPPGHWHSVFDSIDEGVCLVDPLMRVLHCNQALADMVREPAAGLVGRNLADYLHRLGVPVLPPGAAPPAPGRAGPRGAPHEGVIGGRTYTQRIDPIWNAEGGLAGMALILLDITPYKTEQVRADRAEAEVAAQHQRILALEREVERLKDLLAGPQAQVAASLYGQIPLREAAPDVFDRSVREYGWLLDSALEQGKQAVTPGLSERLRALGERLGGYRSGPKDVIEIHKEALSRKRSVTSSVRFWGYIHEGRLLLLELMGYLGNYYRLLAFGAPRARAAAPGPPP